MIVNSDDYTLEYCRGCVGPGWTCIINYFYKEAALSPLRIHIDQIKEKFGGLRLYWSASTVELGSTEQEDKEFEVDEKDYYSFTKLVDALEEASYKICEDCGNSGKMRPYGWIKTLCDKCAEVSPSKGGKDWSLIAKDLSYGKA